MPREEWLQTFRTVLDFCGEWHIMKVQKKEWYFPSFSPKQKKTPSRSCRSERGSSLFSAYGPWTIRQATCRCSKLLHLLRQTVWKKEYFPFFSPPLPNKWAGKAANPLYHSFRQKDTGDAKRRVTVNFLCSAWLLGRMAYNKSDKGRSKWVHWLTQKERPPPGAAISERGFPYLVLTVFEPAVKPLANKVWHYVCCDGGHKGKNMIHRSHLLPNKMGGVRPQNHYNI